MKRLKQSFLLAAIALISTSFQSVFAQVPFVTRWQASNDIWVTNTTDLATGLNYTWKEVGNPANTGTGILPAAAGDYNIIFPAAGTYELSIEPPSPVTPVSLQMGVGLIDIIQWGSLKWGSTNRAFGSSNLTNVTATDTPDFSSVTDMSGMFRFSSVVSIPGMENWDVSNVTDMNNMFAYAGAFNQDISGWDVSNVTTMNGMFDYATVFNQDISGWDVSSVTNMGNMFAHTDAFNQDISGWDVSNVLNMSYMFYYATAFNQNLGAWTLNPNLFVMDMFAMATGWNQANFTQTLAGWLANSAPGSSYQFNYADLCSDPLGGCTEFGCRMAARDIAPCSRAICSQALWEELQARGWTMVGVEYDADCEMALPVIFGNLTAIFKNGQLLINWHTVTENNNSHFDIEASADGRNFKKIGSVNSKGINGNSSEALSYDFSTTASGLGLLSVVAFGLLLVPAVRRNNKWLLLGVAAALISIISISCSKSNDAVADGAKQTLYIRITQVDKDGTTHYSKVVQVTKP